MQTIFLTVYHFDQTGSPDPRTIDAGSAMITISQSDVVVLGPALATIAPSGAATSHILSYVLTDPLPDGVTPGEASVQWDWAESGSAQSSTVSRTIAGGTAPDISGSRTLTWLAGNEFVTGDTHPAAKLQLADGNGPVSLAAAAAIRFISRGQYVSAPVITESLIRRLRSREENNFTDRMISIMRGAFGGHAVKKAD